MLLTFSKPQFVERILNGTKKHTIRDDKKNRWKVGMKIHFWKGNPRNVKNKPYQFATGIVSEILKIEIYPDKNKIVLPETETVIDKIEFLNDLAVWDGFENWDEMKTWFKIDFKGKLIYFKNISPCTQPI